MQINNHNDRDFLAGPVAKTLHSQCRGLGPISAQETRSPIPQRKILSATMKTEDPSS